MAISEAFEYKILWKWLTGKILQCTLPAEWIYPMAMAICFTWRADENTLKLARKVDVQY